MIGFVDDPGVGECWSMLDSFGDDVLLCVLQSVSVSDPFALIALRATCRRLCALVAGTGRAFLKLSYNDVYNVTFTLNECPGGYSWAGTQQTNNKIAVDRDELMSRSTFYDEHDMLVKCPTKLRQALFMCGLGGNGFIHEYSMTASFFSLATAKVSGPFQFTPETGARYENSLIVGAVAYSRLNRNVRESNTKFNVPVDAEITLNLPSMSVKVFSSFEGSVKRESYNGPRDNNDFVSYLQLENTRIARLEVVLAA